MIKTSKASQSFELALSSKLLAINLNEESHWFDHFITHFRLFICSFATFNSSFAHTKKSFLNSMKFEFILFLLRSHQKLFFHEQFAFMWWCMHKCEKASVRERNDVNMNEGLRKRYFLCKWRQIESGCGWWWKVFQIDFSTSRW